MTCGGYTMMEVIHKNVFKWTIGGGMLTDAINVGISNRSHIKLVGISGSFVSGKSYYSTGLTILLPYIISTRSNWEHCKVRIFALANHKQDIGAQEKE